ncbi:hypothetical protein SEA_PAULODIABOLI_261 [Microbacterium phage PauloDiaboli]|nr:hypothetical protein SEA_PAULODIABOLI_261 [Microbacterium phage PauloDiaboli]QWY84068.1 hypothetical protein SEA_A3WALLY_261 [Microbacterium phage A3Wally]
MKREFIASNGLSITAEGDGIRVDNVYLGPAHIDAIDEFRLFLDNLERNGLL